MKKLFSSPVFWIVVIVILIFREFIFLGKIPLPADTLIGSYYPWLDYKWGYTVGVPVKNALTSDAFSTFYVWRQVAVDLLRHGVIPLWNRYSFSGTPLLATFHTAVLFPANILLFLPFDIGWGVFIFSSMLASSLAMYLFLDRMVKSKTGRIVGSLVYALAGPMTTWSQFGTAPWAAALLPLILFCLDQIIEGRRQIFFTVLSLSIASLIFAGHVQLLTYTAAVGSLYFFYRQRYEQGKFDYLLILKTTIFALIGLGIGAIQLLPTIDFYPRSIRSEENYASYFNFGLSHWTQVIRLWAADFFGNPTTLNHFSPFSYHEYSSYLGVLAIPLIVSFLFSKVKRRREALFFTGLFLVSLFLAYDNPISHFIFSLPLPLLTYSSASRIFFLTNLSAAILIGLSIDNLKDDQKALFRMMATAVIIAVITIISIFFIDKVHQIISLRNSSFYIFLLFIFITGAVILRKKMNILIFLILALFIFDFSRYYSKYNTFISRNLIFPQTPITEFLNAQQPPFRIAREDTNLLPANAWTAYQLESVEGYDPLFSSDYAHFFHRLSDNPYSNGISRYALLDGVNEKFLAATNVKYFLTKNTTEPTAKSYLVGKLKENGYQPIFTDKSVTIYIDPNVKDRTYFVDRLRFVSDKTSLAKILDDPVFDPTKEAVIIGEPFNSPPTIGSVISINHQDNFVEIKTKSKKEGFLILADSYDPGWKAYINGREVKVYQVNGALRGVRVPGGENLVIFKYQPKSFTTGVMISTISLFLLFIFQIGLHLNKRR